MTVGDPPISKERHAIYCVKGLDQQIRIRNIKTLGTKFTRSRNLKHKVDANIWGGTTL